MAQKIAVFRSAIVVEFDPAEQTWREALDEYAAERDITESYELLSVEDAPEQN